jgi:hypothetical protein
MSVPLDRLYHFLEDQVDRDMVIYRWFPHGSRNLEHCKPLRDYAEHHHVDPFAVFHDQEPLDFAGLSEHINQLIQKRALRLGPTDWHLLYYLGWNTHSRYILVHSELNSDQVDLFTQFHAVPVYYWSHALIARDWFRYAQHDPVLKYHQPKRDFLIYQRSWSGTREYRLKFGEMVIDAGLAESCRTSFSSNDGGHYLDHEFKNPQLRIMRQDLEQHFPPNHYSSSASADYCNQDYAQCHLEVVLETLCDDRRLHLTEKIMRPMACGQPFMLVATPGSLAYLRSYGFQTFGDIIDESYDQEPNVLERLKLVVAEMQRLREHPGRERIYQELRHRAKFNQQRFFSLEFHQQIVGEYQNNIQQALTEIDRARDGRFLEERWQYSHRRDDYAQIYDMARSRLKGA